MKEEHYQCQYCREDFMDEWAKRDVYEKYCLENPEFQRLLRAKNPSLIIPKEYKLKYDLEGKFA